MEHIGQDIHRIGHNQQNSPEILFGDFRNNALENRNIFLHQIQPGLSRFLGRSGCHHDNRRISHIRVIAGIDIHGSRKRKTVADIQRFSLCPVPVHVNQNHLRKKSALHQAERRSRTHKTTAYNRNFS